MHLFQSATASPLHTGLERKWHPIMLKPKRTPGLTLINSAFNQCRHSALELRAQMWSDPYFYFWYIIQSLVYYHSVASNSLQPHESLHTRPPCPSPTARVYPNPWTLNHWWHPTISSSVIPFSSCPQSFPASGSFQMSQLFTSGSQSIGVSASISPSNEHPVLISFRMDWLDLLAVQGTLKSLLQHHSSKASILQCSAFFIVQLSHPYMTNGKTIALARWTFVDKVVSAF